MSVVTGGNHYAEHTGVNIVAADNSQIAGAGDGVDNGSAARDVDQDGEPACTTATEAHAVPSGKLARLHLAGLI